MNNLSEYLYAISRRGDHYGSCGGILDLLCWSGKLNTQMITLEDARRFYENPNQPYFPAVGQTGTQEIGLNLR